MQLINLDKFLSVRRRTVVVAILIQLALGCFFGLGFDLFAD